MIQYLLDYYYFDIIWKYKLMQREIFLWQIHQELNIIKRYCYTQDMVSPWFDDIFVRMLAPKYRLVYTNIWIDEQNINFNTSLLYIATYNEICLRAHSTAHSFCSLTQYSILFLALMIFPDFFKCILRLCIRQLYSFVFGCRNQIYTLS